MNVLVLCVCNKFVIVTQNDENFSRRHISHMKTTNMLATFAGFLNSLQLCSAHGTVSK